MLILIFIVIQILHKVLSGGAFGFLLRLQRFKTGSRNYLSIKDDVRFHELHETNSNGSKFLFNLN